MLFNGTSLADNDSEKKRILVAVLNWGLGHATRTIPIIRELSRNHSVLIASTGRSLALLRQEFPSCETLDFPDYSVRYSRNGKCLIIYLLIQLPKILVLLFLEHLRTLKIVKKHSVEIIFSDNRYGVYSKRIPCFFMTHQLRFRLPESLRKFEIISVWFNQLMLRNFKTVFVPDFPGDKNLSGQLGHPEVFSKSEKIRYIGPLSSLVPKKVRQTIDALILISGPEPQRSSLEKLILKQIEDIPGHCVVVLGKPEMKQTVTSLRGHEIISHLDRNTLSKYMSRADVIVSRAGYSTIMEMISFKKPALFIPTPGQTEQEYLAGRLNGSGLFYCVTQDKIDLVHDIKKAKEVSFKEVFTGQINDVAQILSMMGLVV